MRRTEPQHAPRFSLFLLFWQQIISGRHSVLGGNPGPRGGSVNEKTARCPLFFRCFSLFLSQHVA
jgi:hypothetical protein